MCDQPHFTDYNCEKPKTEVILTDEGSRDRWLKQHEELVNWCGKRWHGFCRALLHVEDFNKDGDFDDAAEGEGANF